jgi:hypothetical protein
LDYEVPLGTSPVLDGGKGQYHEVNLEVSESEVNGVRRLNLSSDATITFISKNQAGQDYPVSSLGIGKDSFLEVPTNPNARDGTEKFDLRIRYVAGNSSIRGQLAASDAKWDKSGTSYVPTKVVFGGRLERRADGSSEWVDFLRGSVTVSVLDYEQFDARVQTSRSNPQRTRADLGLVLTIPTRPVLNVSLTLNNTVTDAPEDTVTVTGQYKQGSSTINISGATATGTGTLALESTSGVKLSYDKTKTIHPMTKSGVKVGEFNTQNSRLTYADGTFEEF